ncbi:AmiS/UreI family transporter, partial [Neobacillus drentensis]|uniref:AmiS/UreI family transporter n=1 Tax=Neobacillus drentensis TaxID=220684 RepID=UPI002FFDE815
ITWGMWAFLWFLFFLSNALNKKIDHYIGLVAFVQSWVTLTIPALLYFIGVWDTPLINQIWFYVLIISIFSFILGLFKFKLSFKKHITQYN